MLSTVTRLTTQTAFAIGVTVFNLFLVDQMMAAKGVYQARPEIVTINAADMLMGFVAGNAADITDEQLQHRTRALNADLERAVGMIARDHGLVVINSGSVLSGARDITPMVLKRMQGGAAFGGVR